MAQSPGNFLSSKPTATILAWPKGQTSDQVAATLEHAGFGTYESNQLVRRETPFFMGRVKPEFERNSAPILNAGGIHTLVLTQDQIDSVPKPFLAKSLHATANSQRPFYVVEPWRGDGTSLNLDEIFLIVRASVGRTRSTVEAQPRGLSGHPGALLMPYEAAVVHAVADDLFVPQSTKSVVANATEVIEMFRLDGTRVRINSDKFNFDLLGKSKGLTDRQNVDTLMLRLSEQATNAEIDLEFRKFKAPPNTIKTHTVDIGNTTTKNIDAWPSFEFYAVWRYLIQRVVCGLEP